MIRKTWGYRFKTPPPTLQVLFHERPIAELEEVQGGYVFRYLPSFADMRLLPFPGLPAGKGDLRFFELPTYFEERLPDTKRPEIREWILQHQESIHSKVQLLALLGSHTITDPFEFRIKAA